jgi:hypothetical protein
MCSKADRERSESEMRAGDTVENIYFGLTQAEAISVSFNVMNSNNVIALRLACGASEEAIRQSPGLLLAVQRQRANTTIGGGSSVAVKSWEALERVWMGHSLLPEDLAGPMLAERSGLQLVQPLCGDVAPQGGFVSFSAFDLQDAAWRFSLELMPLPSLSGAKLAFGKNLVTRVQVIMRNTDGTCGTRGMMFSHELATPVPGAILHPGGPTPHDEIRSNSVIAERIALKQISVATAVTRAACFALQSETATTDERGAGLARDLLAASDSVFAEAIDADAGSHAESLRDAMMRSGPRLECHGVSPASLITELHEKRSLYLGLESSLRKRVGLSPVPERCFGSHDQVAGRGLWADPDSGPPPLHMRSHLGALLEQEGCLRVGLEVGSYRGANANELLTVWPSAWAVVMVDPWASQPNASYGDILSADQTTMDAVKLAAWVANAKHGPRAVLWPSFGSDAAAKLAGTPLDYVYLDARHDYTSVTEDLDSWWPLLRVGGVLAGHDFLDAGLRNDGNTWEVQPDGSRRADMLAVRGAVEKFFERRSIDVRVTHQGEAYPSFYAAKPNM